MRKKGFVQISYELIKLGTALNHRAFRLIVYLMSFKPCFPSREQIKQEAGLTDDAISKGLAQAQEYNILSYKKGNSKGNSNEYFLNPESEWNLPQVPSYKEKKATSKSEGDHIRNKSSTTSESTEAPPQNLEPNKSNANYTNEKENNELNQFRNNKETFISAENEKLFLKLTEHLHKIYGDLYPKKVGVSFDRKNEGVITSSELEIIWDRHLDYLKKGGSLHGLVKNEFVRLEPKKQRRLPEPRFLISKDSRKSYLHKVAGEAQAEEFSNCFGPIGTKDLKKTRELDRSYAFCLTGFKHLLKVKSIEQYAVDSILGEKKLPPLGPHLFKYAIVKEFYFNEKNKLTEAAFEFYLQQIGHSGYTPFLVQTARNTYCPEAEGWPEYGITRGGGESELIPLADLLKQQGNTNSLDKIIH